MNAGQNLSHGRVSGRILALDVGTRRIGVAVSDPLGLTAQGLPTVHRRNRRYDLAELRKLLDAYSVTEIVVGNPLQMSGNIGRQSEKMADYAAQLERAFSIPVRLWDERLSTAEAHRLLDETAIRDARRKQVIDQMAAVLILQSFLDARAAHTPPSVQGETTEGV
jgi:putative Holliday junction resolvase